jgi:hypothetical protein
MTHTWNVSRADELTLIRIAELIALKIRPGDTIALRGELGTGKSTFARALLRALAGDPFTEIPSPTFAIVQTYETPRLAVAHADLYRLSDPSEAFELGLDDLLSSGALVIEWSERAPQLGGTDRLEITISEEDSPNLRTLAMSGQASWQQRLARLEQIANFLTRAGVWPMAQIEYLQGDASTRAYARLLLNGGGRILMDAPRQPDGPPIRDGLPYSRIAHLADNVRPFVAIANTLRAAGLSTPQIFEADLDRGLLIIEDFGDRVFGREVANGAPLLSLWRKATDTLIVLRDVDVPPSISLEDGSQVTIPRLDAGVLAIETELLIDWYWPALKSAPISSEARIAFTKAWSAIFERVLKDAAGWLLRDFHSPNLLLLPERAGAAEIGIIDFQDALHGSAAYDLVSLLQDARLDVPANIERELFDYYCGRVAATSPDFDRESFAFSYAALGAQRNTKILGIFARLAKRDGKTAYLAHIPRIWHYLERDLAHPELRQLKAWYELHFPPELRARKLNV